MIKEEAVALLGDADRLAQSCSVAQVKRTIGAPGPDLTFDARHVEAFFRVAVAAAERREAEAEASKAV